MCKQPIDLELPYTEAMSFTADHIEPRSRGGALLGELRAAHRRCNSRRGNRANTQADLIPTTREW
ncbi:HNH endonuclease [Nocardia panacis]|uniref:HNH endonuclease n=1 Tax=Nocardia panacis TaxID=2340916 RepID=A0A3A4K3T2_9NOCA|nr:HNH endonuclease [Nocardia panacis]